MKNLTPNCVQFMQTDVVTMLLKYCIICQNIHLDFLGNCVYCLTIYFALNKHDAKSFPKYCIITALRFQDRSCVVFKS